MLGGDKEGERVKRRRRRRDRHHWLRKMNCVEEGAVLNKVHALKNTRERKTTPCILLAYSSSS